MSERCDKLPNNPLNADDRNGRSKLLSEAPMVNASFSFPVPAPAALSLADGLAYVRSLR